MLDHYIDLYLQEDATEPNSNNLARIGKLYKRKAALEKKPEWEESFDESFRSSVDEKTNFFKNYLSNPEVEIFPLHTEKMASKIDALEKDISLAEKLIKECHAVKSLAERK